MSVRVTSRAMASLHFGIDLVRSDVAHVVVSGELDLATLPALRERLLKLIADGYRCLCIDLSGVTFCDSSGLGVFVGAHRRLRAVGGDLELHGARPSVRHLFEVSGLDQVFNIS